MHAYIYPIKNDEGQVNEVILMHEEVTEKKRIEDAIRLIARGVAVDSSKSFFSQMISCLAQIFEADYAFVAQIEKSDNPSLSTLAMWAHGEAAPDLCYRLAGSPCEAVLKHGSSLYLPDVQKQFPHDAVLAQMGVNSYLGIPVRDAQDHALGVLVVLSRRELTNNRQANEILEIFAARAGAEIQRLQTERHIHHLAYHDYLTGLPNRALLHQHLARTLSDLRGSGQFGALLLIDLDHFKIINDALGHDVGDEVLAAVSRRLCDVTETSAFVARFGGDEFVALLNVPQEDETEALAQASALAQTIVTMLAIPIFIGERSFLVGASIGGVVFSESQVNEYAILRQADMALYQAKDQGRGSIHFYQPGLQRAASERLQLEEGLRRAIANAELTLHFQPLVNAQGRMAGAEALLRWHHPVLGDIGPSTFIPVAEETGLIHAIGAWILNQACACLQEWQSAAQPFEGYLSVNVCAWQFARQDYLDEVRSVLARHRIAPGSLMLELTESAVLLDVQEAIRKLASLREMGVKIALDDFGTGYSSLAYLRDLPLDVLKIDRSFISELSATAEHPLVESMIAIGRHMHLNIVAEGIETAEQRDILLRYACDGFQGYFFSHPLPEEAFLSWMQHNRSLV